MESGLEDVVAAETVLSDVDGRAGQLIIRGASLDALAGARFEDVVAQLWSGFLDDLPDADVLPEALGAARLRVFAHVRAADAAIVALPTTEAVRALIARLGDGAGLDTALDLVAAPAVFAPAIARLKQGFSPIAPDPSAGHAADVLRMLHGRSPVPAAGAGLKAYIVPVIDPGLNP